MIFVLQGKGFSWGYGIFFVYPIPRFELFAPRHKLGKILQYLSNNVLNHSTDPFDPSCYSLTRSDCVQFWHRCHITVSQTKQSDTRPLDNRWYKTDLLLFICHDMLHEGCVTSKNVSYLNWFKCNFWPSQND